jgi:cytochrome c oxidase subunit 2
MKRLILVTNTLAIILLVAGCGSVQPGPGTGGNLVASNGCLACHSVGKTSGVGPAWSGLFGSTVTLSDGSTLTADEVYLEESIIDPNAKIVAGYSPYSMPSVYLVPEEVQSIIAYIKSLK